MKATYPYNPLVWHGSFFLLLMLFSVQCMQQERVSLKGYNWNTINYVTINRALKAEEENKLRDVDAEYESPTFGSCGGADDLANFSCK